MAAPSGAGEAFAFTLDTSVFDQDSSAAYSEPAGAGPGRSPTALGAPKGGREPLAEVLRAQQQQQQGAHKRALTIDIREGAGCGAHSWDSIVTCPSRLEGTGFSPCKAGATFDPFSSADDSGVTPMPRFLSMCQPVAPRKSITTSPLPSDAAAKLFPEKPHSCPPGGAGRRAARPVVRVRVKRSLNLASNRAAPSQGQDGQQQQQPGSSVGGEQQPEGEGGGVGQLLGGVRKRSELFSPPVPRKFSRSMEDIVAAGIFSKLQLGEPHQQQAAAAGVQLPAFRQPAKSALGPQPAGQCQQQQHQPVAPPIRAMRLPGGCQDQEEAAVEMQS